MEKYESNFDYDPQTYCKVCDGNLRGIEHLLKCQNSELKKAKPSPSQVEQDYETFETKEKDNSEKVDKREEKNHETLVENEEGEMNAFVKAQIENESDKVKKNLELIRVLKRQVLSPEDRLRINEAETEAETLMETINQAKDFIKRREMVKNETSENDLKRKTPQTSIILDESKNELVIAMNNKDS